MNEVEFDLLEREDLAKEAKPYYDCEKARRVPGWQPPPRQPWRLSELTLLRRRLQRRFWTILICIAICVALSVVWSIAAGKLTGFFPGMLVIAWLYWSSQRTGCVVVWLRRFHRKEQKPFQYFLENACKSLALPVTIQDSSFRYSASWFFVETAKYMGPIMLLVVVPVGMGVFFASDEFFHSPLALRVLPLHTDADDLVLWVIAITAILLLVVLLVVLRRGFSFVRLRQSNAQKKILRMFDKVRAGKSRNAGVALLRCEDSFWRDVVALCLQRADAIVIDVADPTENVLWEIKTALELTSPERILLACPADSNASQQLPVAVSALIQTAVGDVPLNRFSTFFYPPNRNRTTSSELGNALIKCMSYAPPHDAEVL